MVFSNFFWTIFEYFFDSFRFTQIELGGEPHTIMFLRQLDANIEAHSTYQARKESSKYTTFRLKKKDIPLEDFLSLYETLYNIESKGNMSTIITIRKRDKDLPDNKDMNMKNLASALQEYLYNESGSRFNVGNMVVTIESVRKEHMPGFCTISNRSEKVRQVHCKLNTLLIDLSDRFLLEKYEKWMRDWFYRYTIELLQKLDVKDCSGYEQIFEKINAYFTNERPKQIFGYMKSSQQEAYQDAMEEKHNIKYSPDLKYIRPKLLEFEEEIGCKYFTYDLTEYDKILNMLKTYYEHCSYRDLKLAFKKGNKKLEKLRSEQTVNNIALKSACATLLKNLSFEEIKKHAATNFETITETEMCVISDICHGYIEAVGLLAKYKQLFASNRSALNRQRKRFEIKNVVKLVVSEKASVNNLNFLLDVIDSENVLNDLNESQLVFLDLGRAIESSTLEEGMKKYKTKKIDLNNGAVYIFSANEVLEVVSKNVGFGPKCDANEPQERKNLVSISWKTENIVYDEIWKSIYMVTADETNAKKSRKELTDAINKPMLECLADSNSRPTGLYKLAVQSSSINTDIYLLNHKAIFDNCERVSVIYAFLGSSTSETSNEEDSIVTSVICLADVPPSHLIDLLKYLQMLQARPETEFIVPNILKLKGEIFACFDNRLELTGKYKMLDFYECFENMVKCESTDPYLFNENPQYIKYWSYITYNRGFQIYQNLLMEKGEDDIIYNHIQDFFVDNDLLEDELNDPCILSIDSITYENETYPCFDGPSTHPQHFCVTKKCSPTESLSSNPLQIINILLNSKHKEDVFDALSYIVNIMKSNADVLHMAIDEMCTKDDFSFLSFTDTQSQNNSNMVNVLKRFGSLFGHFENWKSQNVCKTKDDKAYFEEQKTLIKTKIETLLKILFDERRDLETYTTIKMTSIRQIGGAAKNATDQLEKLKLQGCDMAYVNFSCLKVSKKIFSKDKWGRRYTTRN